MGAKVSLVERDYTCRTVRLSSRVGRSSRLMPFEVNIYYTRDTTNLQHFNVISKAYDSPHTTQRVFIIDV